MTVPEARRTVTGEDWYGREVQGERFADTDFVAVDFGDLRSVGAIGLDAKTFCGVIRSGRRDNRLRGGEACPRGLLPGRRPRCAALQVGHEFILPPHLIQHTQYPSIFEVHRGPRISVPLSRGATYPHAVAARSHA